MKFPGSNIKVVHHPDLGDPPQFSGKYWPGMSVDHFENAYYEVAEPLYSFVLESIFNVTTAALPQIRAGVDQWVRGNVPANHPVIGAQVKIDPRNPQDLIVDLVVANGYENHLIKMIRTKTPRGLGTRPAPFKLDIGPFVGPRPPKPKPEGDGWDDDPLEL